MAGLLNPLQLCESATEVIAIEMEEGIIVGI
jgi:hypothetical protein